MVSMGSQVGVEQQLHLVKPVSRTKIKAALWSIAEIKSPGSDGYGSGFFKQAWETIADDF